VNVPTSGTPVPLSTDSKARACRVLFQAVPGLTGKAFIGTPHMSVASMTGVVRVVAPNSANGIAEAYELVAADGSDSIYLAQLAIDIQVSGEGLLVSYWVE
jgi:hypothetical protein